MDRRHRLSLTRAIGDNFFLTDGLQNNSGWLVPGSYSVAELALAGWDLTSATCSDTSPITAIDLAAGETVTCVFTNTRTADSSSRSTIPGGGRHRSTLTTHHCWETSTSPLAWIQTRPPSATWTVDLDTY